MVGMVGNSAAYKPMYLIDYINAWRKVYNTTIKQCGMYFMAKKYDMFGNVCGGVARSNPIIYYTNGHNAYHTYLNVVTKHLSA